MIAAVCENEVFCPASAEEWRGWLEQNHETCRSVWLVYYKKQSGRPTVSWSEAVDHALCFGWVDSRKKTIDEHRFMQFFSTRKSNGTWSKINKQKVHLLTEKGLMHAAGMRCIKNAMENGSWSLIDQAEELLIPEALQGAFDKHPGAEDFFSGLSRSVKKGMLQWLALARREKTLNSRMNTIAHYAAMGQRPAQFR